MVTFVNKNGDTANIRLISCETSKMVAAINGCDKVNLDAIINDVNADKNIRHVNVCVSYYPDETKIINFIKTQQDRLIGPQQEQQKQEEEHKEENHEECCEKHSKNKQSNPQDFICPKCGDNECLVDRHGNKYPCYQCIQIDVGQKILKNYGKEFKESIKKNNTFLEYLGSLFMKSNNSNDIIQENKDK